MSRFTADQFINELQTFQSDEELEKYQRYFKFDKSDQPDHDYFIGVRTGDVFRLAKTYMNMAPDGIEKLLESPVHEIRVGGVSVMDWQARSKRTAAERREELFNLYLRRHDRINNWDLVDRSAQYVVGAYLYDFNKPRDILYQLARSQNMWERRTALVSTAYFIRRGDLDDVFNIAEMLTNDDQEPVQKAAGWMLRTAGGKNRRRLLDFLDKHAVALPRIFLRNAIEKLDKKEREYYLNAQTRKVSLL